MEKLAWNATLVGAVLGVLTLLKRQQPLSAFSFLNRLSEWIVIIPR